MKFYLIVYGERIRQLVFMPGVLLLGIGSYDQCLLFLSSEQEGTRLKADYELTWDKVGFFRNTRRTLDHSDGEYRKESIGYTQEDLRRKRFRVMYEYDRILKC